MSLVYADRVQETTSTTGTGTVTLAGASTQFQSFAAVGDGNTCDYCLLSGNGTDWETGRGTYTASGTTLSRDTVFASSNSGSHISLTGTSTVFLTAPAHRIGRGGLLQPAMTEPPTIAGTGFATWLNQSGASIADSAVGVCLSSATNATFSARMRYKTPPSTPYHLTAGFAYGGQLTGGTVYAGMGYYDGTNKLHLFGIQNDTVLIGKANSPTSYNSNDADLTGWGHDRYFFLRISDDGTTITWEWSADGENFITVGTTTKSSGWLGSSGYSNVGIFIDPTSGSPTSLTLMSYAEN